MEEFAQGRGWVRVYYRWYDNRGDITDASEKVDIEPGETQEMFELRVEELLMAAVNRQGSPPADGPVRIEHIEVIPNVPII